MRRVPQRTTTGWLGASPSRARTTAPCQARTAAIRSDGQPRLVAQRDDDLVGVAERRQPALQRRERALLPVGADHDVVQRDRRPDLVRAGAEHHDDAVAGVAHGGERVLEQRTPVERRELLGPAEAPPLARRQDDAGGQAPTSWMRPPARASRPPSRPLRTATTSLRIDSAVSSELVAPRSRPDRRGEALELGVGHPGGQQALAPGRLRAPRAHRADVDGVGAQRDGQRGVVELGVVREDDDRRRPVDPAQAPQRLVGPRDDDVLRAGEALAGGEARARVDHVRPPADAARRGGTSAAAKSTAPNTISRGAGCVTSTNSSRSPSSSSSERSAHISSSACASTAGSSSPSAVPSARDEHARARALAAQHGDERAAPALAGQVGEARRAPRPAPTRRSRRRTAGRRPTPRCRRCRSAAAAARRRRAPPRRSRRPRPRRSRRTPRPTPRRGR